MVEWEAGWHEWLRLCSKGDEPDTMSYCERVPRERAADGKGCIYSPPAADGTVLARLDERDVRHEHVAYFVRRDGAWDSVTRDQAFDVMWPGVHQREAARKAEREASIAREAPYRPYSCHQPRGGRVEQGMHEQDDGTWTLVTHSDRYSYHARRARPAEVAAFLAESFEPVEA